MAIKFLDLKLQQKDIMDDINQRIANIFENTSFILGPEVAELEQSFVNLIGTKYAIGVASGTDALLLSLSAVGVGYGDEVITSPFTFNATVDTVCRLGAKPVFVDIDENSLCINPDLIESKITSKTKAIIPVHIFGRCADMDKIMTIAHKHDLPVIEDVAQATGVEMNGRKAGSIGTTGCFSFYPTKNLGGAGDGGMITTNHPEVLEKIEDICYVRGRANVCVGQNSRLDSIQAAYLNAKMPLLEKWNKQRIDNSRMYKDLLCNLKTIKCPEYIDDFSHVYNLYTIRAERRDELAQYLKDNQIGCAVYYALPLHLQPYLAFLDHKDGDFPVSEDACRNVISIPAYPGISQEDIKTVAETIINFY